VLNVSTHGLIADSLTSNLTSNLKSCFGKIMTFNLEILNELKEIMEDDFDELISLFVLDGQAQIDDLKKAVASLKAIDVRQIAHTLKGSSANIGMFDLSESCKALEFKAADASFEGAEELLEKIINDFNETKKILKNNF